MSTKVKQATKWRQLASIGAIIFAITLGLSIATSIGTYPTRAHRETGLQLTQQQGKMLVSEDGPFVESDEYKELLASPEAQYSSNAGMIGAALGFFAFIVIVFRAYGSIRRRRLSANPVSTTVGIYVLASIAAMIVQSVFDFLYVGNLLPGFELGGYIITIIMTVGLMTLFTFLVALIAESRYNRKHSFIVE